MPCSFSICGSTLAFLSEAYSLPLRNTQTGTSGTPKQDWSTLTTLGSPFTSSLWSSCNGAISSIRSNKRLSILQADPIRPQRRNLWLFVGMVVAFMRCSRLRSSIHTLFGTASVPIEFWLTPLPLALGILMMDEVRKLFVRSYPNGLLAEIAWWALRNSGYTVLDFGCGFDVHPYKLVS